MSVRGSKVRTIFKGSLLMRDPLLRLLFLNGLTGLVISGVVLAGLFATNVGQLRYLILKAEDPVLPIVMLAMGLFVTLGSVVMGTAIMMLRDDDRAKGSGGRGRGNGKPGRDARFSGDLQPIRVEVRSRQ